MLELKHIKKSYDGVTILNDVNLEIEKGEIVSILGPSGCGKTTLLNLILGMTDADSGSILLEGEDITRVPMEKRGFNIVFQDYALFPNLNVYQNITYGLRNKPGISSKQEVEEFIDLLGLREHLEKKIDQLSGGQKQRTELARTMDQFSYNGKNHQKRTNRNGQRTPGITHFQGIKGSVPALRYQHKSIYNKNQQK